MDNGNFMDRVRMFLGLRQQPPRNDFRNPIWGSDDDDDGDELYTRANVDMHSHLDLHQEITKHMQDIFKSFGGLFSDINIFSNDLDHFDAFTNTPMIDQHTIQPPDSYDSDKIRNYYLKPGYLRDRSEEKKDIDLDGKISSQEISGLLKRKDDNAPFDGNLVQGVPFCQTIITTSVKKSDGTVETRRIVKSGNEVIEETTTSTGPSQAPPNIPGLISMNSPTPGFIISELTSLFKNFH